VCDRANVIIQLLYGFRVWMAWSKHAGMLRELRKARETRAEGEWFCALFLTRATFPSVWIRPSKHGNGGWCHPKQTVRLFVYQHVEQVLSITTIFIYAIYTLWNYFIRGRLLPQYNIHQMNLLISLFKCTVHSLFEKLLCIQYNAKALYCNNT
jgi:hypothetical protein